MATNIRLMSEYSNTFSMFDYLISFVPLKSCQRSNLNCVTEYLLANKVCVLGSFPGLTENLRHSNIGNIQILFHTTQINSTLYQTKELNSLFLQKKILEILPDWVNFYQTLSGGQTYFLFIFPCCFMDICHILYLIIVKRIHHDYEPLGLWLLF